MICRIGVAINGIIRFDVDSIGSMENFNGKAPWGRSGICNVKHKGKTKIHKIF